MFTGGVFHLVSHAWIRVPNSTGCPPESFVEIAEIVLQVFPEQQELMQRTGFLELIWKEEKQQTHQMMVVYITEML